MYSIVNRIETVEVTNSQSYFYVRQFLALFWKKRTPRKIEQTFRYLRAAAVHSLLFRSVHWDRASEEYIYKVLVIKIGHTKLRCCQLVIYNGNSGEIGLLKAFRRQDLLTIDLKGFKTGVNILPDSSC